MRGIGRQGPRVENVSALLFLLLYLLVLVLVLVLLLFVCLFVFVCFLIFDFACMRLCVPNLCICRGSCA